MRIALILLVALNGFSGSVNAQTARSALADLSDSERDDIARVCLPVQYREGASAYRACVTDQIAQLDNKNPQSDLSGLSFDDRYAIQQACPSGESAAQCIKQQIRQLNAIAVPRLDNLSNDEHYVLQQACFAAQTTAGAAAYRQCQLDEIRTVENVAKPDYSQLSVVERNALQLRCSADTARLSDYRNCLLGTVKSVSEPAQTAAAVVAEANQAALTAGTGQQNSFPASTAVQVNSVPTYVEPPQQTITELVAPPVVGNDEPAELFSTAQATSTVAAVDATAAIVSSSTAVEAMPLNNDQSMGENSDVIDLKAAFLDTEANGDKSLQDIENNNNADQQNESTGNEAILEQLREKFDSIKNAVLDLYSQLSNEAKWMLLALIALPFALWILLAGRKRRDYDDEEDFEYEGETPARHDLSAQVRQHQNRFEEETDPLEATWEADADSLFEQETQELHHSEVELRASEDEPIFERRQEVRTSTTSAEVAPVYNGFASWLHQQPWELQQSLAIEFLIYWMAYGDERYTPALKERIFLAPDPDAHDLVKRWVLKEDVHAFADVIDWLQRNTTAAQQQQIIILLMSLLINGNTPTPVQNTLLRFLGDVFHASSPSVEEQFEQDFGLAMPPIPRVDRVAWWQRQMSSVVVLWDARSLSGSDAVTRAAAQLGVSADSDIEHIEAAYERAIKRCRSDRFDQLGEREQQLIASRRTRLVEARDELLEALS